MINVQNLSRTFSGRFALQNITFSAELGERIAIIGRNGAGKTTLLRILSTFIPATSGSVIVDGHDIFKDSLEIRKITGYLPENAPLYPEMRVAEYLKFRGRLRRMPRLHLNNRFHEVMSICDLGQYRNMRMGTLSNGIRHRIGIADAILDNPKMILLEDPLTTCDPYQTQRVAELLTDEQFSQNRVTFFTSHSIETIRTLATRVIFLERGSICKDTTHLSILSQHSLPHIFSQWTSKAEISQTEESQL